MDPLIDRLKHVVECTCREVINSGHPLSIEAVGGQEELVFEADCKPGDEGLTLGGPCRPWTEPHGHTRAAAIWEFEKPLQEPVTRVVLEADESAMADEGLDHD